MKKLIGIAVVLIIFITGSIAMAAINTLTVKAAVTGTCKFTLAASTLDFGTLDPSSSSDATGTASPTFWCTKGAGYTATSGNGLHFDVKNRMMGVTTATEFIPYSLVLSPATGTGSGPKTSITLTVTGTILNADYVDVKAQSYADTVILTVLP